MQCVRRSWLYLVAFCFLTSITLEQDVNDTLSMLETVRTSFHVNFTSSGDCTATGAVVGRPCLFCKCFKLRQCTVVKVHCNWKTSLEHLSRPHCRIKYTPDVCCPAVECQHNVGDQLVAVNYTAHSIQTKDTSNSSSASFVTIKQPSGATSEPRLHIQGTTTFDLHTSHLSSIDFDEYEQPGSTTSESPPKWQSTTAFDFNTSDLSTLDFDEKTQTDFPKLSNIAQQSPVQSTTPVYGNLDTKTSLFEAYATSDTVTEPQAMITGSYDQISTDSETALTGQGYDEWIPADLEAATLRALTESTALYQVYTEIPTTLKISNDFVDATNSDVIADEIYDQIASDQDSAIEQINSSTPTNIVAVQLAENNPIVDLDRDSAPTSDNANVSSTTLFVDDVDISVNTEKPAAEKIPDIMREPERTLIEDLSEYAPTVYEFIEAANEQYDLNATEVRIDANEEITAEIEEDKNVPTNSNNSDQGNPQGGFTSEYSSFRETPTDPALNIYANSVGYTENPATTRQYDYFQHTKPSDMQPSETIQHKRRNNFEDHGQYIVVDQMQSEMDRMLDKDLSKIGYFSSMLYMQNINANANIDKIAAIDKLDRQAE